MVSIGIIGVGFMGMIHYLAARRLTDARVTAICSRDPKKLAGDWRGIHGNFGPAGEVMDLAGVQKYDRLDALLADPDIDLVDVCNPTALHPETALAALRAGKHVLVEKAIALRPEDADAMVAAARQAGRLLLVAHVLPFFPEFTFAAQMVRGGEYGRLLGAHFRRVISRPDWSSEIADPGKTGGPAVDLHIHDTHFIGLVCGVPGAVFSTGIIENGAVQYLTTQYLYGPGGPCVSCSSGAVAQPGRPFVHGYEIYLEKATLAYESGTTPLTLYTADGKTERPRCEAGDPVDAFADELRAAVKGVVTGQEPRLLSGQLARDALVLCHKECESVRTGAPVAVA
ncbi:MAG TPA: Gfo/Idh/MocA family oxidoreductase [Gemmataceae bacterium]|nr:Gfo/Idh/MocA family oxidoreductase [Gemmataceae bacterium]